MTNVTLEPSGRRILRLGLSVEVFQVVEVQRENLLQPLQILLLLIPLR